MLQLRESPGPRTDRGPERSSTVSPALGFPLPGPRGEGRELRGNELRDRGAQCEPCSLEPRGGTFARALGGLLAPADQPQGKRVNSTVCPISAPFWKCLCHYA